MSFKAIRPAPIEVFQERRRGDRRRTVTINPTPTKQLPVAKETHELGKLLNVWA